MIDNRHWLVWYIRLFKRKMNRTNFTPLIKDGNEGRGRPSHKRAWLVSSILCAVLCAVVLITSTGLLGLKGSISSNEDKPIGTTKQIRINEGTTLNPPPFQSQNESNASNVNETLSFTFRSNYTDGGAWCRWAPGQNEECTAKIRSLVCRSAGENKLRRLLYFGDSTTSKLFDFGGAMSALVKERKKVVESTKVMHCRKTMALDRCDLNKILNFPYRANKTWTPPMTSDGIFEGPVAAGLANPYCQDCWGCFPGFLECQPANGANMLDLNPTRLFQEEEFNLVYGGFMGNEFARDVELQSPFHLTTQENVAYYLNQTWNTPEMLQVWEKPTCIVNTGHHDVMIPGITLEAYIANVRWYLHLLADQCEYILWVATSSPGSDDFVQKIRETHEWGMAVQDLLATDSILRYMSLYIDLYEASYGYPHDDNSKCTCVPILHCCTGLCLFFSHLI